MPHSTRLDRSVPRTPQSTRFRTEASTRRNGIFNSSSTEALTSHSHRQRSSTVCVRLSYKSLVSIPTVNGPRRSAYGSPYHHPRSAMVGTRFPLPFPDDFGSTSSTNQDVGPHLPPSTVRDGRYTVPAAISERFWNQPIDIHPSTPARRYPPVGILPPKFIHTPDGRNPAIKKANQSTIHPDDNDQSDRSSKATNKSIKQGKSNPIKWTTYNQPSIGRSVQRQSEIHYLLSVW